MCVLLCVSKKKGELFHIDFGFMFGKDPKPLPPPMKLCREMVEAMGGAESAMYHEFQVYCCEVCFFFFRFAALYFVIF